MAQHYKNSDITKSRVKVFIGWEHFNPKGNVPPGRMDQNLCGRLWTARSRAPIQLSVASPTSPLINPTAKSLQSLTYRPATVGQSFGPTFATHVFRLDITIPSSMHNLPVHLLWDSNSEALVFSGDGTPQQGLVGGDHWCRRADYLLFPSRPNSNAHRGDTLRLYIEIACNGLFGAGRGGDIEPPDPNRYYKLEECCLAVFDPTAWDLIHDLTLLSSLAEDLPDGPRRVQALHVANNVVNAVQVDDPATYPIGRRIASKFLSSKNGDSQSVIHSMLHSHIDLAWLWPMASTPAKGARTFSTQLRLMDRYPDCLYVQSQAQLFQWVKDFYPSLWKQICTRVAEGRFVPVGATWVEMDCNIPCGESLVRQFIVGQKFFEDNFGLRCKEFWLPDTFGYCAQLPQIMKGCGVDHFLTQKLSWNLFNKFPHSSFIWEGLDGARVLAHMPPADTYNAQAFPEEILRSANKNKDSGIINRSVMLVGHGDGGGGASPSMVESMMRMKNLDGVPKVQFSTPDGFFAELKRLQHELPRWVGELYFELHRGTYTSQANTKKSNRYCEILLRDLELASTQALIISNSHGKAFTYPSSLLEKCWKLLLKNCFHDTLPGSCIRQVYDETCRDYQFIIEHCTRAVEQALDYIGVAISTSSSVKNRDTKRRRTSHIDTDVSTGAQEVPHARNSVRPGSSLLMLRDTGSRPLRSLPLVVTVPLDSEELPARCLVQTSRHSTTSRPPLQSKLGHTEKASLIALKLSNGGAGIVVDPAFLAKDAIGKELYPARVMHCASSKVFVLSNRHITARVSSSGRILSLLLRSSCGKQREVLADASRDVQPTPGGNRLVIFDDVPQFWCAWDTEVYSFEKYHELPPAKICEIVEDGPLRAGLRIEYPPTKAGSVITQHVFLRAESLQLEFHTEIDWKESRKILRVLFETEIRSSYASYGSQFGYVTRPTTFNHSWEIAKFEVVGHQFCDLSEPGFGVALLSDYKYGYSVRDSTIRLSLLRASKSPDDEADQGTHQFVYAFMPHWNSFPTMEVLEGAADLGCSPLLHSIKSSARNSPGSFRPEMTFAIANADVENFLTSVVISAVKIAERNLKSVVVRLYEAFGDRGKARMRIPDGLVKSSARICNMLEEEDEEATAELCRDSMAELIHPLELVISFRPFQIRTIMIDLAIPS